MLAKVSTSTLSVTHVSDGEEVITGGDDGQVWIGTFADRSMAAHFVNYAKAHLFHVNGERRAEMETPAVPCPDCGHSDKTECLHEPGWKPL